MNDSDFQRTYEEQNRREYITNATIATVIQIPLNLSCSVMDYFMYPDQAPLFFKGRVCSVLLVALAWLWFKFRPGHSQRRFGIMWIMSPLIMILWLIYAAGDPHSPYYAGLNIILLGMGLLTPWAYLQNLLVTLFVLVMYAIVSFAMKNPQPTGFLINNTTFLFLTSVIVVSASIASARQRLREFTLRYELDKSKHDLEESNRNLGGFNTKLAEQNIALNQANREIKEAEAKLVQAEKMSSLGRYSAGLMHDILNPLNYTRTGTFTLRKKSRNLPPEMRAEFEEILTDIEDGLKRVDNIVSDLRTFTHPGEQASEAADVADILNLALRFVSSELKDKHITVELNLEPNQSAWIGRNHFVLVLVNVLENSIDALAEKTFAAADKPAIQISSRSAGGRSLIVIRDNGPGIALENLAKIFDPFFTT